MLAKYLPLEFHHTTIIIYYKIILLIYTFAMTPREPFKRETNGMKSDGLVFLNTTDTITGDG